jgi:protein-S-isoprenylcysteine O-methyltransferase Ste14
MKADGCILSRLAVNPDLMFLPILATSIRLISLLIEYPYLWRHRIKPAQDWDRHSAKLWDAANVIEPVGMVLGFLGIGRIQTFPNVISSVGVVLLVAGITIRWTAIYALGKYFTGLVVIKTDHRLIRTGLYKHLRHPAYTGTLLMHLGLGLSFASWVSLGFSTIPYFAVALYRMRVEERALAKAFGAEYTAYAHSTKRLIPGLY